MQVAVSVREKVFQAARDGMAITMFAILCNKNLSEIEDALKCVTEEDGEKITPLIVAAKSGHDKVVETLLSHFEVNLEQTGTVKFDGFVIEGATALWCCAGAGHLNVAKVLVDGGADVNHPTLTNSTPLRAACFDGRLDIVKYLVEHQANIDIPNKYSNTCLMISCYRGHLEVARYLLQQGSDPNLTAHCGATALHFAAECGHLEIVKCLLDFHAKNIKNDYGMTPLMVAAESSRAEIIEYLVSRNECSKIERVEALELLGASYGNDKDNYDVELSFHYMRLAMLERFSNSSDILEKCIKPPVMAYENRHECKNLEELDNYRHDSNAIHLEALIIRERILGESNPELPHPIIYRGAVFADTLRFDRCLLLWLHAMKLRYDHNRSISKDLLRFAQVFSQMIHLKHFIEPLNMCALWVIEHAVLELHRDIQRFISCEINEDIETIQDVKIANIHTTLYLIAIITTLKLSKEEENTFCESIYKFVRLDMRLGNGYTPLHIACSAATEVDDFHVNDVVQFPNAAVVKLLLKCGAKVNAVDKDLDTPLHVIVCYNKPVSDFLTLHGIITSLVDYGAHIDMANLLGQTAFEKSTTGVAEIILRTQQKMSLKCMAARVVKKSGIECKGHVPIDLEEFIEMH